MTYSIQNDKEYDLFFSNFLKNQNSTYVLKNEEENAKGVFFVKGI